MPRHVSSLTDAGLQGAWVAVGSFDGVHRGHQALIGRLVEQAHAAGDPAAVVTFFPHPAVLLRGLESPFYLTDPQERAELLGALGVDAVITLPFDRELAALTAREFMLRLRQHLGLRRLWVGPDFALGRARQGTVPVLREIGDDLGYAVDVIETIVTDGGPISSSLIRERLAQGDMAQVNRMLGRRYTLRGPVEHGDARGHGMGIPTANLVPWEQRLLPAAGVYATWAYIGNARIPAVTNIGTRPTFENSPVRPRIEAHLLDFSGDLYDQPMRLEFLDFIRPERRFPSPQELLAQIGRDVQTAREVFSRDPAP